MKGQYELNVHPRHVQRRAFDRSAPLGRLRQFDSEQWTINTAEVRADKEQCVNTAWEVDVSGVTWWVVTGFDRTMKTVIRAEPFKGGLGQQIVRGGPVFDYVEGVNRTLMGEAISAEGGE